MCNQIYDMKTTQVNKVMAYFSSSNLITLVVFQLSLFLFSSSISQEAKLYPHIRCLQSCSLSSSIPNQRFVNMCTRGSKLALTAIVRNISSILTQLLFFSTALPYRKYFFSLISANVFSYGMLLFWKITIKDVYKAWEQNGWVGFMTQKAIFGRQSPFTYSFSQVLLYCQKWYLHT